MAHLFFVQKCRKNSLGDCKNGVIFFSTNLHKKCIVVDKIQVVLNIYWPKRNNFQKKRSIQDFFSNWTLFSQSYFLAIFDAFWPSLRIVIYLAFLPFWVLFKHFYLIMVSCSISLIMPWLHLLLIKVTLTTLLKLKAKSIGFTFLTIVTLKK